VRGVVLALALAPAPALALLAVPARAAIPVRRYFEPTDLELENPGVVELDLQLGFIRSQGPYRLVVPDFEADLGILPNLELDIDGALAIEGPQDAPFALDHVVADNLWVSVKLGLFDLRNEAARSAWAGGVQVGPKLPLAPGADGIGVEGLLLLGRTMPGVQVVLNLGGLYDPPVAPTGSRPAGIEGGFDLKFDLPPSGVLAILGELAGVAFVSDDPNQLLVTAGIDWQPREWIEISLVGLVGFLMGSDQYGLLLGISPKFRVVP